MVCKLKVNILFLMLIWFALNFRINFFKLFLNVIQIQYTTTLYSISISTATLARVIVSFENLKKNFSGFFLAVRVSKLVQRMSLSNMTWKIAFSVTWLFSVSALSAHDVNLFLIWRAFKKEVKPRKTRRSIYRKTY